MYVRASPPIMFTRGCLLAAMLTLGTADALGLGGNRRRILKFVSAAGLLAGNMERFAGRGAANAATVPPPLGETNSVVRVVDGIRQKRLGGTDIVVSEMGLGTQRWGSTDFNGPDEALCHQLLDRAVLRSGVNLVDTAEQYPIPSDRAHPEGTTERIIGSWLKKDAGRRQKLVLASKITGGRNVNRRTLEADLQADPDPPWPWP